jgi:hypothetical protein
VFEFYIGAMKTASSAEHSLLDSFRDHVLSPLETAQERVDREYTEVGAERRAYEQFEARVASIETVTSSRPQTTPMSLSDDSESQATRKLRNAFRATVMSVDHYDDVYGETLEEHVLEEFSADVATVFRDDRATPFTDPVKAVVTAGVQESIQERDAFLRTLDREQDSLAASRRTIASLLDEHDGPRVPGWYRSEFETTLEEVAERRQEAIRHRPSIHYGDCHDFCTYLYRNQDWTYPVLTATARFRRAVTYEG